jgi:hypothetical protein
MPCAYLGGCSQSLQDAGSAWQGHCQMDERERGPSAVIDEAQSLARIGGRADLVSLHG